MVSESHNACACKYGAYGLIGLISGLSLLVNAARSSTFLNFECAGSRVRIVNVRMGLRRDNAVGVGMRPNQTSTRQ